MKYYNTAANLQESIETVASDHMLPLLELFLFIETLLIFTDTTKDIVSHLLHFHWTVYCGITNILKGTYA